MQRFIATPLVQINMIYLLLLLISAVCIRGHKDKIDVAILEVSVKNYNHRHSHIAVLAQNSDCYQCPFLKIGSLRSDTGVDRKFKLHANHTTYIKLVQEVLNSSDAFCQKNLTVVEHAHYQLIVKSVDDNEGNVSCEMITIDDGVDAYLPVLYAFICLSGLAVLWIIAKRIYKYKQLRFANFMQSESLVQEDLGSTNAVQSETQKLARKPPRLKSLDTFRGLSLTIMIFVNYGGGRYWFFAHSSWNGLTVADLVFPWFIFIMGSALAFVFNSHHRRGKGKLKLLCQIVVRCIKLFVLGLMVNSVGKKGNDLSKLRIPGVLQRFSLTYLVVALTELVFSSGYTKQILAAETHWYHMLRDIIYFWPNWLIALTALLTQVFVTFFVPYDMHSCPTGYIGPGGISEDYKHFNCTGGIAKYIDLTVFGKDHIYQRGTCRSLYHCPGTDPEGLLGTLASIFLCFLGVQAGRILVVYSCPKERVARWLIWAIFLGAISALLCGVSQNGGWIPLNKNLWSATFVTSLGSMAFILLAFLYVVIDVKEIWTGAPFFFPGMNSIFVYMGSEVLHKLVPISFLVGQTHIAQLFVNIWSTAFWVLIAAYMYYKKIFITV